MSEKNRNLVGSYTKASVCARNLCIISAVITALALFAGIIALIVMAPHLVAFTLLALLAASATPSGIAATSSFCIAFVGSATAAVSRCMWHQKQNALKEFLDPPKSDLHS